MPQTGAIGIHIEANSSGYSRDIAVANARQIGGAYATVVNDPALCLMLLDVGVTPIYRINRGGLLDDNAHQRGYSAREYVRTAAAEVPDKRAIISVNNEPGQNDLERLRDFMLEAIDEANALGRTLACLNWSYGNPEPSVEYVLDPLYRAIAAGGHFYCVHEGTDEQHPTLASCVPFLIGRFLGAQLRYGFKVLVTEFAASKDAWNGWQTWNSNYAQVCEDAVREVYAPNGVHMTPFTAFPWKTGFDYVNSPELKAAWAQTNVRYPVKEQPPVTQPTYPPPTEGGKDAALAKVPNSQYVFIRQQPNPTSSGSNPSAIVGELLIGDVVQYFPDAPVGAWVYVDPQQQVVRPPDRKSAAKGWVSLQNGAVEFVPPLLPPIPAPSGRLLTPEAEGRLRAHLQAISDATAAIVAELDSAPEIGAPPDSGIPF